MKHIINIQNKLTKLHLVVMMKRDCKLLIGLNNIVMVQVLKSYVKQRY